VSTYVASDVLIRERSSDDDEAIVSIRNDANPDLPPITVERYRFQADPALTPPGGVQDRFVAKRDGRVVGLYFLGGNWFVERPNTYIASVGVARSVWRQGIGGRLYQHLMERAKGLGAERLYGNVVSGDEHSLGFVERRGFRPDGRIGKMSRLTVAEAKEPESSEIEDAIATAGIEIRTLSQIGLDDQFLHRLHSVEHEIGKGHSIVGGVDPNAVRPVEEVATRSSRPLTRARVDRARYRQPYWPGGVGDVQRNGGIQRSHRRRSRLPWTGYRTRTQTSTDCMVQGARGNAHLHQATTSITSACLRLTSPSATSRSRAKSSS
jgi:GNAT superfamily N-acetyltransferase